MIGDNLGFGLNGMSGYPNLQLPMGADPRQNSASQLANMVYGPGGPQYQPSLRDKLGQMGAMLSGGAVPAPTTPLGKFGAGLAQQSQAPPQMSAPAVQLPVGGQPGMPRPMSVPELVALYNRNKLQQQQIPGLLGR